MPKELLEDLLEERADWLRDFGEAGLHVHEDDVGEYILIEVENGTAGEDGYSFDWTKVRLPKHLQTKNIHG